MGLFKCSKCECVENTALGHYWGCSRYAFFYDWDESNEAFKDQPLCSECGPKSYSDIHQPTAYGKWHGHFKKRHISEIPEEERKGIYNL